MTALPPTSSNFGDREEIRILIAGHSHAGQENSLDSPLVELLSKAFPEAVVDWVGSESSARETLLEHPFSLVILDEDLFGSQVEQFVHELRFTDSSPAVLLLARVQDSIVDTGVPGLTLPHALVKQKNWTDEVAPTVRQLLRMRKLVSENARLIAKLTEANHLLEDRNRRLDEFSATLAHDIRGPLGAVSMKLDYILDKYGNELPGRVGELIDKSKHSVQRLTSVVQAMYEYAKLGRQASKMKLVNLKALVSEVVEDITNGESREVQFKIDELPQVWGNSDLLRRVFLNLISNAVKFGDKSPTVIKVYSTNNWSSALGEFVDIVVEDNGPGIPKEEGSQDLFVMFARGKSHHTEKEGLGIGLAVVHRIVELHRGRIIVSSAPGVGTKFTVSLPVRKIELY